MSELTAATELNGCEGIVLKAEEARGRLRVLLVGGDEERIMLLEPTNLIIVPFSQAVPVACSRSCAACGAEGGVLMTCGRCRGAAYCGAVYQRNALRSGHQAACVSSARLAQTALLPAAYSGDLAPVKRALDDGAAINTPRPARPSRGRARIYLAARPSTTQRARTMRRSRGNSCAAAPTSTPPRSSRRRVAGARHSRSSARAAG